MLPGLIVLNLIIINAAFSVLFSVFLFLFVSFIGHDDGIEIGDLLVRKCQQNAHLSQSQSMMKDVARNHELSTTPASPHSFAQIDGPSSSDRQSRRTKNARFAAEHIRRRKLDFVRRRSVPI